jgi:hypothetical protein
MTHHVLQGGRYAFEPNKQQPAAAAYAQRCDQLLEQEKDQV